MSVQLTWAPSGVATLTIDRPERRNALDETHWHQLRDAARAAERALAVIVTGGHGHFCAGMDLSPQNPMLVRVQPALRSGDEDPVRDLLRELKDCVQAVADIPVVTIAAIEGACVGGGLEIALACDIRVAAIDASLSLPEVRVGMIPDLGGTARLTRLIGPGRAADLITTGRTIHGEEALRMGVIEHVAPSGGAVGLAESLAAQVLANGPTAVRLALNVIRATPDLGLEEALSLETRAGVLALVSGEPVEGVSAFFERRAPRWKQDQP